MEWKSVKQVGIMTWYSYENYGTALQAVALNRAISGMGYEAFDIAYDPALGRGAREVAHRSLSQRVAGKVKYLSGCYGIKSEARSSLFKEFVASNLKLTQEVSSKEALRYGTANFDAYVCGSDQVWSPRGFDSSYYLDFVEDSTRLIAYAPSFGCDSLEPFACAAEIGGLLRRFGHIGVRESAAVDIVERCTGKRPPVVVDPTLLLSANDWSTFARPVDEVGPYCLVYFLGDDGGNWKAARAIAKARGLRVVVVPVLERDRKRGEFAKYPIGPAEFLWLVSHAKLVCTDSFHGMVFSTIFSRDFVAFERFDPKSGDSQNTRVYSYLGMTGAADALLPRSRRGDWRDYVSTHVDYASVAPRIEAKKVESLDYLTKALMSATTGKDGEA